MNRDETLAAFAALYEASPPEEKDVLQRTVNVAMLACEWAKARRIVGTIGLRASRAETEKLWAASDRLEVACLGPREKKGTADV